MGAAKSARWRMKSPRKAGAEAPRLLGQSAAWRPDVHTDAQASISRFITSIATNSARLKSSSAEGRERRGGRAGDGGGNVCKLRGISLYGYPAAFCEEVLQGWHRLSL